MLILVNFLLFPSFFVNSTNTNETQDIWPTDWMLMDIDPKENGGSNDYRNVNASYYNTDGNFLFLRLECYGYPNFSLEDDARYKWCIGGFLPFD